jgi:ribosomal protein S18 acetylase RimI-like enzyme
MALTIQRTSIEEAESLLDIQKKAFYKDWLKYEDPMNPYHESLERLKSKIEEFEYFTIYCDDKIIGGADIRKRSENHYRLNRIYMDPSFQNQGLGYKAIRVLESYFKEAKLWELDTPKDGYGNQHLYEKLGYKKTGEHVVTDKLTLFDYIKKL